jgi:hypothetical protein
MTASMPPDERVAGETPKVTSDAWPGAPRSRATELALLVLRRSQRDPCAERVAIELDRRRSPAERDALSERQADAIAALINAVLDGLALSAEQRDHAVEIAALELRRAAGEELPHDDAIVSHHQRPVPSRGRRW